MAISSYQNLFELLTTICPERNLYGRFVERAAEYLSARARLGDAITRGDPRLIQFETDVQGRYRALKAEILETNEKIRVYNLKLPTLPTRQEGIDTLVSEVLNDLFKNRKK